MLEMEREKKFMQKLLIKDEKDNSWFSLLETVMSFFKVELRKI